MTDSERARGTLILLRHGQSTANRDGLFTGVLDVPLTLMGEQEAAEARTLLRDAELLPRLVIASELRRAYRTAQIVSTAHSVGRDWRLNERNYGMLTGRAKTDVVEEFGDEQFHLWRRSLDQAPPPMEDGLFEQLQASEPFCRLPPDALTRTEALSDVIRRVRVFLDERVFPTITLVQDVLIVAHGNSLRAVCSVLDELDAVEVEGLNVPTGHPLVYNFDRDLHPTVRGGRYLDEQRARQAAAALTREGGT